MQIYKIEADNVFLLYHSELTPVEIGSQFIIKENVGDKSILVQVIQSESLDYPGIIQELIQDSLEDAVRNKIKKLADKEPNFLDIKSLKIAHAKIRKTFNGSNFENWDGWIPTRNCSIETVSNTRILDEVIGKPEKFKLNICENDEVSLDLDAKRLDMINVITGIKGSGKSHTSKNILLRLSSMGIPCVVYDLNNEYAFDDPIDLKLGENLVIDMSQMEPYEVYEILNDIMPFSVKAGENVENNLVRVYNAVRRASESKDLNFYIDIQTLIENISILVPGDRSQGYIQVMRDSVNKNLETIRDRGIFVDRRDSKGESGRKTFQKAFMEALKNKKFIRLDIGDMDPKTRRIFVKYINKQIRDICDEEFKKESHKYPFIFFEEAHIYIDANSIIDFITRGRHIGIRVFFITNTPDALPEMVFRQLDNLFVTRLSHQSDIKHVSRTAFTDELTIKSLATRIRDRHLLVIGSITNNYPFIVKGTKLPNHIPSTGATRSLWDYLE